MGLTHRHTTQWVSPSACGDFPYYDDGPCLQFNFTAYDPKILISNSMRNRPACLNAQGMNYLCWNRWIGLVGYKIVESIEKSIDSDVIISHLTQFPRDGYWEIPWKVPFYGNDSLMHANCILRLLEPNGMYSECKPPGSSVWGYKDVKD